MQLVQDRFSGTHLEDPDHRTQTDLWREEGIQQVLWYRTSTWIDNANITVIGHKTEHNDFKEQVPSQLTLQCVEWDATAAHSSVRSEISQQLTLQCIEWDITAAHSSVSKVRRHNGKNGSRSRTSHTNINIKHLHYNINVAFSRSLEMQAEHSLWHLWWVRGGCGEWDDLYVYI